MFIMFQSSITAQDLLIKLDLKESMLTVKGFQDLCPVILEILENQTYCKVEYTDDKPKAKANKPSTVAGIQFAMYHLFT